MASISVLLAAAVGFTVGWKLKDCLCKKKGTAHKSQSTSRMYSNDTGISSKESNDMTSRFSLYSLELVFNQYNIPITSDYSFSRLLDAIEKNAYVKLLTHIDCEIISSKSLYEFLENENFNITNFKMLNSTKEPYLTEEGLIKIFEKEGMDYSQLETPQEKVEFLLALAQGKGTKRFQKSFGNDLSNFIDKYNLGEDTEVLFNSIKSTVHSRLEFLS